MSLYQILGGELFVKSLVSDFYQIMDSDPKAKTIRAMHIGNLQLIEEKLFMFLSGWLGGPSLYIEKYGHPRLRQRHISFSIGAQERDEWMYCITTAFEKNDTEKILGTENYQKLWKAVYDLADFMQINKILKRCLNTNTAEVAKKIT